MPDYMPPVYAKTIIFNTKLGNTLPDITNKLCGQDQPVLEKKQAKLVPTTLLSEAKKVEKLEILNTVSFRKKNFLLKGTFNK